MQAYGNHLIIKPLPPTYTALSTSATTTDLHRKGVGLFKLAGKENFHQTRYFVKFVVQQKMGSILNLHYVKLCDWSVRHCGQAISATEQPADLNALEEEVWYLTNSVVFWSNFIRAGWNVTRAARSLLESQHEEQKFWWIRSDTAEIHWSKKTSCRMSFLL